MQKGQNCLDGRIMPHFAVLYLIFGGVRVETLDVLERCFTLHSLFSLTHYSHAKTAALTMGCNISCDGAFKKIPSIQGDGGT